MYLANPLRHPRAVLAVLSFLLSAGNALALPGDKDQPIELAADSVDVSEGSGISVYRGNVELRQGSILLRADVLTVHQKSHQPSRFEADGKPVYFEQQAAKGKVTGRARRAEYASDSAELLLTGDAELTQGADRVTSDRIVYDRVRALVKAGASAQGKERVRITIQPPAR